MMIGLFSVIVEISNRKLPINFSFIYNNGFGKKGKFFFVFGAKWK